MTQCSDPGCNKEARVALRTTRPSRDVLKTVIFYDDRTAPKTAERLCSKHGRAVAAGLMAALVAEDS